MKKAPHTPKKLSNIIFIPCVPFLFYGSFRPQNRAPTPSLGAIGFRRELSSQKGDLIIGCAFKDSFENQTEYVTY